MASSDVPPAVPSSLPVWVEPAGPADWPHIGELAAGVYRDEGFAHDDYLVQLADVAGRAARAQLLVARDEAAVLGSVALVVAGDFGEVTESDDEAAFRMLVVDAAARGHGIGELLVTACLEPAGVSARPVRQRPVWRSPSAVPEFGSKVSWWVQIRPAQRPPSRRPSAGRNPP